MRFQKNLNDWYLEYKRDLPWRKTIEPSYIWLSEIILQQTQVVQGTPYYVAFIEKYPTVFDLAAANEVDVLKLWQGLGYYSRARNLHATAKYVANQLNGVFPNNYKALLDLKGVGDYTASAIASFCFNEATAVVDGNVFRVLSRYFGIDTPINTSKGMKEFKALAQKLMEGSNPSRFNQALMEFGAIQCRPKNPNCITCIFNTSCVALSTGVVANLPVKNKSAKAKKKYFNFLVFISEDGKTVLEKREGKGIWQNLYQFPLIETTENADEDTLRNYLKRHELLEGRIFKLSIYNKEPIVHKLSHQHLYTTFWIINTQQSLVNGVLLNEIETYPVPILIGKFIESFNFY